MARRESGLFPAIADFTALREAALRAARGKRHKPRVAQFLAGLETEVLCLQRELLDERWQPGAYTEFIVRESKPRLISAAPFRDRVVHHALCAVIGPLFERGFIRRSYASRKGRGTHRAVASYEQLRDRYRHVLRADVFRYFPAIDHAVLKQDLRRRIACERTLRLCDTIIDGSNAQEPVNLYFPGDDLFSPFERRRGLPIGNLTSQLFGNLYLDPLDHYVSEVLRAPYLRYLDDFALFDDDAGRLARWREDIAAFLEKRRLRLHPIKTFVTETSAPAQFLGYVLGPGSRRRLPEENIARLRGRLRSLRDRWRAGTVSPPEVKQILSSWIVYARHANTVGLRHGLFRGGWFDPQWADGTGVAGAATRRNR
ncbi:MAG: RNA-dependent DNA polymerase [Candidatus Accumulibacter meliphilus]|jgi:RNA-directed DNA polymerase|uniref:RNA-dependent DNA polymerase n=1 Tax=Candidatus Accumulibacter meliphilus TaxID=2211374 RepID=A0A369XTL0_9PROT|nr:MAG: RNA-dependent DNA polymerase [Candidatus Accumulibacter meliphilus]